MSNLDEQASRIAEAVTNAWWAAHAGNLIEIPLGVVAALMFSPQPASAQAGVAETVSSLEEEELLSLLGTVWAYFWVVRPELCSWVGPLASWLDNPTPAQARGAHAAALAAIDAGLFDLTARGHQLREVDLLGHVYQSLRSPEGKKAHGEVYTPTTVADTLAHMLLTDAVTAGEGADATRSGARSFQDPCAGTGGLFRAAAQALRARSIEPGTAWWFGADIDPPAVACLAVNAHHWGLGPRVVVGIANTPAEPEWERRLFDERRRAFEEHRRRLSVARLLAAERAIARQVQTSDRGIDPSIEDEPDSLHE